MQPNAMTNDDFDLNRFIKLMGMTTADSGEAINAIRMANRMLRSAGWTWEQLLRGKITIVNDPFGSIPDIAKPAPAPPPRPAPPSPPPPQRHLRDPALVEAWFDVLDFAQLNAWETQGFNRIRKEWKAFGDNKMFDSDFQWLHQTAGRYTRPTTGRGKAKRVF